MNVRRLTTRAVFLLLALTIYPGGTLQQPRANEIPESTGWLRFGQSIALSDFDSDGLVDEARLDGSSFHKSVGILLSGTGKRSFLHFNGARRSCGSLFAQDIDHDGTTDLIWVDPFNAADVVVWLGDGCGRFECADPYAYGGLTLGSTEVAPPNGSNQEAAINCETIRPLDQAFGQKYLDQSPGELPSHYPDRVATSSPALGRPSGRDPPLLLS